MARQFLAFAALVAAAVTPATALWPQPRALDAGSSMLQLAHNFQISVAGHGAPSDLWAAVARTEAALRTDKLGRLVVGRGASDVSGFKKAKALSKLAVSLDSGAAWQSVTSEA